MRARCSSGNDQFLDGHGSSFPGRPRCVRSPSFRDVFKQFSIYKNSQEMAREFSYGGVQESLISTTIRGRPKKGRLRTRLAPTGGCEHGPGLCARMHYKGRGFIPMRPVFSYGKGVWRKGTANRKTRSKALIFIFTLIYKPECIWNRVDFHA